MALSLLWAVQACKEESLFTSGVRWSGGDRYSGLQRPLSTRPADHNGRWAVIQRIQRRSVTSTDPNVSPIQRSGFQHLPGVLWNLVRADRLLDFQVDFHASNYRRAGGVCRVVLAHLSVAAAWSLPFALQSNPVGPRRNFADVVAARDGREQ